MIGAGIGGGGIKCSNLVCVFQYVHFTTCHISNILDEDVLYKGYKSDVGNCFYDIPRKLKGKILMSYDPNWSDNIRSKNIMSFKFK